MPVNTRFSAGIGFAPRTVRCCVCGTRPRSSLPEKRSRGDQHMLRHLRSERGVTLVELMVVVAIIAIIAAIAVTIFQDLQKKAKLGADQGSVGAMRSAVALYYGKNNGLFPSDTTSVSTLTTPV